VAPADYGRTTVRPQLGSDYVEFAIALARCNVLQHVTTALGFDGYKRHSPSGSERHAEIVQGFLLRCVRPSFGGLLIYKSFFDCQWTSSHRRGEVVDSVANGLDRNREKPGAHCEHDSFHKPNTSCRWEKAADVRSQFSRLRAADSERVIQLPGKAISNFC
jgi:hypothetical protein